MTAATIEITEEGKAAIRDWEAEQKARTAICEQVLADNKSVVFEALRKAAIVTVHIEFDGSGDEGTIDGVTARDAHGDIAIPEFSVDVGHAGSCGTVTRSTMKLAGAVEEVVYDILTIHHDGWEINDGAFGELTFDVSAGTITYEHHSRFTETETFSFEL